jgi:hypothetical protein
VNMRASNMKSNCHDDMIHTPAREAISWVKKAQTNVIGVKSPYAGHPSPDGDMAWRELLKNSNIRVSEDTLRKINMSSIALQDGSGMYMGGLSVHHHLHCVVSISSQKYWWWHLTDLLLSHSRAEQKSIRRVIYRDYYNLTDEPVLWAHLDHCLEDIRLALMCNADASIITYDWLPNYKRPWGNWHVEAECVDWEKLDGWAGKQAFSLFDQKSLVHPDLGLAYPNADGSLNQDSRIHPSAKDIASIAEGTNPKGNWGPGP